jgi:hypothetical protein
MGPRDLHYLPLEELCRRAGQDLAEVEALISAGALPQLSYVLPEGTGMFPADDFALWDTAGDVGALADQFQDRSRSAAATKTKFVLDEGEVEQAWKTICPAAASAAQPRAIGSSPPSAAVTPTSSHPTSHAAPSLAPETLRTTAIALQRANTTDTARNLTPPSRRSDAHLRPVRPR